MPHAHELHCYDYVNQPYAFVSQTLRAQPREVFSRATKAATHRAQGLAANLKVELGGLEVGAEIAVEVLSIEKRDARPGHPATTTIKLAWRAARAAALFPSMNAELVVYALTGQETQLELHGTYRPPLGALGGALDSIVGHRVAEASVRRFVEDIATYLSVTPASA